MGDKWKPKPLAQSPMAQFGTLNLDKEKKKKVKKELKIIMAPKQSVVSKIDHRWRESEDPSLALRRARRDDPLPTTEEEKEHREALRTHLSAYFKRKQEIEKIAKDGKGLPDKKYLPVPGDSGGVWGVPDWSNVRKIQDFFLRNFSYSAKHPKSLEKDMYEHFHRKKVIVSEPEFKKPMPIKSYPRNRIPRNFMLPFDPKPYDQLGRTVVWSDTWGATRYMGALYHGLMRPRAPAWLMKLEDEHIRTLKAIKDIVEGLADNEDMTEVVDLIGYALSETIKIGVTREQICKALRWTPLAKHNCLSFPIFILTIANYGMAIEKRLLMPRPRKFTCNLWKEERTSRSSIQSKDKKKPKTEHRDPMTTYFRIDVDGEWIEVDRPSSSDSSDPEPPPFKIRGPEEYMPAKERIPMDAWKARVKKQRKRHDKRRHQRRIERYKRERERREQKEEQERLEKEAALVEKLRIEAFKLKRFEAQRAKDEKHEKLIQEQKLARAARWRAEGKRVSYEENRYQRELKRRRGRGLRKPRVEKITYTLREKVLYSALVYFEIHEAMMSIARAYRDEHLKNHELDEMRLRRKFFGHIHKVGTLKRGEAEWERHAALQRKKAELKKKTKKPVPALSPYLSSRPICVTRRVLFEPWRGSKLPSSIKLKTQHWTLTPPSDGRGSVILTENKERIKKAMRYVFRTKKLCVCCLPQIHLLMHFDQPLLSQITDVHRVKRPKKVAPKPELDENGEPVSLPHRQPSPMKPKTTITRDLQWVSRNGRGIYSVRPRPSKLIVDGGLVSVDEAKILRARAEAFLKNEFATHCEHRMTFRDRFWSRMQPTRIPEGRLRDSFTYAFVNLFPHKPQLPNFCPCDVGLIF